MENCIEVKGLKKTYGDTVILDNLNLDIKTGEILVVMGSSGVGKSTFLRILGRLESYEEGDVWHAPFLTEKISVPFPFVFQEFDKLLPWFSVKENILLANPKGKEDLKKLLSLVGLSDVSNKYPYELSGGMKQRVQIARALICKSNILLMDEPFGSLDQERRTQLQDLILEIQRHEKMTVVFVTHDKGEAHKLGDRILYLENYCRYRIEKNEENKTSPQ